MANVSRDTTISGGIEIAVELPKSLGQELYQAYLDNKANFSSPSAFVDNVFKGIYIKNTFGSAASFAPPQPSCRSSTTIQKTTP